MSAISLSSVFQPLSLRVRVLFGVLALASAPAFAEMSLTYSASLAEAVSGEAIVPMTNLTATAEMTVMLYPSPDDTVPLWCRRFATEVVDGCFAAELRDSNGSNVVTHATYGTLEKLFARTDPAAALWVEVSDVRTNGQPLAGLSAPLPRGKLAAAPFAVVADRAASARNGFVVRGTATVTGLKAIGNFEVVGSAEFAEAVTFADPVTFGADALTVTGTVSKTNLDGIGTLTADALVVSKSLEVGELAVTNGAATALSAAAAGFVPPGEVRVAGTFAVGGTLTATNVVADCLAVDGTFTVAQGSTFVWDTYGTLTVPDGVYEADSCNSNLASIVGAGEAAYENETGRNVLLTYAGGSQSAEGVGSIAFSAGTTNWVHYGSTSSVGVNVTTLFPLAKGDRASANHVFTRYVKELSK